MLQGLTAGKSMNCATCHLVEEQQTASGFGMRSYADFNRRSPIPLREDGRTQTTRNTPSMVNADIDRKGAFFLHFDGQFTSVEELAIGGLTGRNFGWLPNEGAQALGQIVKVIRQDDGSDDLAKQYYGSYTQVFGGTDPAIPPQFVLPPEYRLNVQTASDSEIVAAVGRMIGVYQKSLLFKKDADGNYSDSPYDVFLRKNALPRKPNDGESALDYARRLCTAINALGATIQFVDERDGHFKLSAQQFSFGPSELQGLKIFLTEAPKTSAVAAGVGNCIACHAPPDFTDFKFHNTGATQAEYDDLHGIGAFARLKIPGLKERNRKADLYLAPSEAHPKAAGIFISPPEAAHPEYVDLGLWNVLGNPDLPNPQAPIKAFLCGAQSLAGPDCRDENLLPRSIALFKTPSLRDLGQSFPYLHTGQKDSLEDVMRFYQASAELERRGMLRNGAPELALIKLGSQDVSDLANFLRSLNEDYH